MVPRFELLVVHSQGVTHLFQQPPYGAGADLDLQPTELLGDFPSGSAAPFQTLDRIPSRFVLEQMGDLFDHLTVDQNVRLKMRLAGKREQSRIGEVLEMVGIDKRRHAYPTQLSGGEASRAGLAVALAPRPPILIADEPTGEVDTETEQRILSVFDEHRKSGGAILIVTHSQAIASRADRVIRLEDGKVVNA